MSENVKTTLRYYGISPWEIEVLYGFLNSHFTIIQDEIEANDDDFVSFLDIDIPLQFNEEFFKWFEFKRWEKIKDDNETITYGAPSGAESMLFTANSFFISEIISNSI